MTRRRKDSPIYIPPPIITASTAVHRAFLCTSQENTSNTPGQSMKPLAPLSYVFAKVFQDRSGGGTSLYNLGRRLRNARAFLIAGRISSAQAYLPTAESIMA